MYFYKNKLDFVPQTYLLISDVSLNLTAAQPESTAKVPYFLVVSTP
jgi:hypothetical protein